MLHYSYPDVHAVQQLSADHVKVRSECTRRACASVPAWAARDKRCHSGRVDGRNLSAKRACERCTYVPCSRRTAAGRVQVLAAMGLLPLCLLRSMDSLKWSSLLGMLCVLSIQARRMGPCQPRTARSRREAAEVPLAIP